MPTNKNAADVELSIMGGLCSEMEASDLPMGASPLSYDTDYDVGRARTRDGLGSAQIFINGNVLLQEQGNFLNLFLLEDGSGVILLES